MSAKKQGFLLVRESSKAWTRLWVSLRHHQLFFFRDKTKSQEVLKVNIKDAKISGTPSIHSYKTNVFEIVLTFNMPLESPRQKTNVDADAIVINTVDPILLSAPSTPQKTEWIEKLTYCAHKDVFDEGGDVSSDESELQENAQPQEQENLFVSFKDFPNVVFHIREEDSKGDTTTGLVCAPLTNVNDIIKSLEVRLHTQPGRLHMYLVVGDQEQLLDQQALIVELVNKHHIATISTPATSADKQVTSNTAAKLLVKEHAAITSNNNNNFKKPKKKKKLFSLGITKKRKPSKEDVSVGQ